LPQPVTATFSLNPADIPNVPNPGTGTGDPRLLAALLPPAVGHRPDFPGAVVAMPDTDPRSHFIPLRQASTALPASPECDGWYNGLWTTVVSRFNVPGVQLAVTEQVEPSSALFSEAIITGPAAILGSLAGPALPAACRTIVFGPGDSVTVRPLAVPRIGLASWSYDIVGTRTLPVRQWVEVVSGPSFLLELRIPTQTPAPKHPATLLPQLAAAAYQRALSKLT
jgi:hypothetical protein